MRGLFLALLVALGAVAMVVGPVAAADAATLQYQYGRVIHISDGDTFGVRLDGQSTESRIRLLGLQATEVAHRAGEINQCGSLAAKQRISQLISNKRVRLSSFSRASKAPDGRLLRYAAIYVNGGWQDVGATLADGGFVLWEADRNEWYRNREYNMRTSRAAANHVGPLWHTTTCGSGPQQEVPLKAWAQWDADGDDNQNINGEYLRVRNLSSTTRLNLSGWAVRDRSHFTWRFPSCASIAPGATVTLRMGSGQNDCAGGRFYAGMTKPLLGNPDEHGYGNGLYLLDPQTDIRSSFTYPCGFACTDPLQGKVSLFAQPAGTEYIDVKNVSNGDVDLEGRLIENQPYTYEIRGSSVVPPGQRLRLYVGRGTDRGLDRFWNLSSPNLRNDGETVRLRTFNNILIGCFDWGDAHC